MKIFLTVIALAALGVFFACALQLKNTWPLYSSGETRKQAQLILAHMKTDKGFPLSFYSLKRLACAKKHCTMELLEQWNLTTVKSAHQSYLVGWDQANPLLYEVHNK